jgi:arylsulfatase I/J
MATPRHTPKGRGFDSSLIYFHHTEDPWIQMENGCGNPPEAEEAGIEGNPNNTVRDLWAEQPDETFGHPAFDKVSPLRCEAQSPSLPYPANETGCTFDDALLTSFILDRIHDHADQNMSDPMFLYWATRSVHGLQQAPKLWFDRFSFIPDIPRRKYAAMVSYIDDALGNVTQALKDTGLYDNTLIWLMSDNGGAVGPGLGNNYPLKGGKFSNWEGGIRANSFLSGGVVPETLRGTKSEMLTTGWDIYATVCELAGVDKTDGRAAAAGLPAVDSISQVGLLAGNTTAARSTVVIGGTCYECSDEQGTRSNATVHGIISDEREASGKLWKLLIGQLDMDGWTGPLFPNMTGEPVAGNYDCGLPPDGGCLFDLESDPTEHVDVASANPSVRDRLIDMLLSANKTIYSPNRGKSNPLACETATTKYHFESGDFWGPFLDLP